MHPTDTLALSGIAIARAAASGVGSGAGLQAKEAQAADRSFEQDLKSFAASLEAMWSAPSTTRIEAGNSTSARMGEGFAKAYADHYGACQTRNPRHAAATLAHTD